MARSLKNLVLGPASSRGIDLGLLLLRVAGGALMFYGHGMRKLLNFAELSTKFSDPIGIGSQASLILAAGAEGIASLFVIIGLLTRPMALWVALTMLVAALVAHAGDPFATREKALLFITIFVPLIITGAGRLSLDHVLLRRRG